MNLHELYNKLNKIDVKKIFIENMEAEKPSIIKLNTTQMLDGVTSENKYISPSYNEDSYFKSQESAKRYIAWKSKISPNKKRPNNVPNLYINGKFHKSIDIIKQGDIYRFVSNDSNSGEILKKFKDVLGLNTTSKLEIKRKLVSKTWIDINKKIK